MDVKLERVPRQLLGMLVCEGTPGQGSPVLRATLIEHLWGEPDWTDDTQAMLLERRLTSHVSKIRTALNLGRRLDSDYGVSVRLKRDENLQTDWDVLGRASGFAGDRQPADTDEILEALELVRGPLLGGLKGPAVLEGYRDKQLEMVASAIRRLGQFDEGRTADLAKRLCGGDRSAIEALRRGPDGGRDAVSINPGIRFMRNHRDRMLNGYLHASTRLRLRDLWEVDGLLVPFRWREYGGTDGAHEQTNAVEFVAEEVREGAGPGRSLPILVLAHSGVGKSIFTHAVANLLRERGTDVLHVDLRALRDSVSPDLDAILTSESIWSMDEGPVPIVDGMDEFLTGLTRRQVTAQLQHGLFNAASVLACRTQYYERYLAHSEFGGTLAKIELLPWRPEDQAGYIRAYIAHFFPSADRSRVDSVIEALTEGSSFSELLSVPLRLAMAMELIDPLSGTGIEGIGDVLALYERYADDLVGREVNRGDTKLDAEEFHECLRELAWEFYDEGGMERGRVRTFTARDLREFAEEYSRKVEVNASAKEVCADLELRSILVTEAVKGQLASGSTGVRFGHKSFHEFYAASYIDHAWRSGPKETGAALLRFVAPEVSEFLKEYIARRADSRRQLERITGSLIGALELLDKSTPDPGTVRAARHRIACQQICYYLGVLPSREGRRVLVERLESEKDPWIRRGIVIGLAFQGEPSHLHRYVGVLRAERERGGPTPECDVNTGFHLSFFGDQPFSIYEPDLDQGLPEVGGCVERLIYQLGTNTDWGSWRLNLFTLDDLWRHREVSRESYRAAMIEHLDELRRVCERLSADPDCAEWPELAMVEELVTSFPNESEKK